VTVRSYPLGRPRSASQSGGDCRARDLSQVHNVFGPWRFAATTHCRINNGLLRLTVGAAGATPTLTVEARRGRVVVGDFYSDTYSDTYGGSYSTPAWFAMGTLIIDSPSVAASLIAVRLVRISPEVVTIRLVAPLVADAFVTLRRGERHCRVQHGSTRAPLVVTDRRVRWTASPALDGTAYLGRVEETAETILGFRRYVGAIDSAAANAGTFSVTAASVTSARFGAGVGTPVTRDRPHDLHRQLGDTSRPRQVVA